MKPLEPRKEEIVQVSPIQTMEVSVEKESQIKMAESKPLDMMEEIRMKQLGTKIFLIYDYLIRFFH
jgi:hypothetical protein